MLFKKTIISVLFIAFVLSCSSAVAFAAEPESVNVYVTICDENGSLVLAREQVSVTDSDSDGVLSISDALYSAHELKYEGGAAAGYSFESTDFGLSLTKLWGGENGGSYGYYLNNVSPMSLADAVSEGDSVSAFAFTDLTAWSDTYCFFSVNELSADTGEPISLTLNAVGFDESWNSITYPVKGAVIEIDGVASGVVTDAEGQALLTLNEAGTFVISASSASATLVRPVCIVSVSAASVDLEPIIPQETLPASGDNLSFILIICIVSALLFVVALVLRRKDNDAE